MIIKILDLFAGTQSVRKALDYNIGGIHQHIEYIGIDIYSPEKENLILDLTSDNIIQRLEEVLPKDWKPNFIWASPICNKFSSAIITKDKGNFYFELDEYFGLVPRKNWNINFLPHMKKEIGSKKSHDEAVNSKKMVTNTLIILKHFNVPFAIENPRGSLIKHLLNDYKKTIVIIVFMVLTIKNRRLFSQMKQLTLKLVIIKVNMKIVLQVKRNVGIMGVYKSMLIVQEFLKNLLEMSSNKLWGLNNVYNWIW